MRRLLRIQSLRFLLVGGINTGFSYGIYALLVWLGMGFVLANLSATVIGIVFSFRTQGRFVFGNTDRSRIVRFVVAWLLLWLFNIAVIALLARQGLNAYAAGAIALVPTVALSFIVQKRLVFQPDAAAAVEAVPLKPAR